MHRLPPIPSSLIPFDPLLVGTAARFALGGSSLHQRPTLWVTADADAIRAACPDAAPGDDPAHLHIGGWRVRAVDAPYADLLAQRPVTLDAFGQRPNGDLVDPQGGVADLRARRLVVRGQLTTRPADVVDALALASELALTPPKAVMTQVAESAGNTLRADRHRMRRALTRLLVGQRPSEALQWMSETGVLPLVLPEAAAMIGFHRSSRFHHKDVWAHTCQVVKQAVPRITVRWAALLHDVGKVYTRSFGPKRTVHFLLHDELGAVMTEGVLTRLRFPSAPAHRIERLVRLHLRANLYVSAWSDAAIRRFTAEAGPELEELLLLSRADVTSKRVGKRRQAMYSLHELQSRVDAVRAADAARKPRVPKGLGKAIITDLGITPGPAVGDLRQLCDIAARDGRLPGTPSIDECIAFLRVHAQAA